MKTKDKNIDKSLEEISGYVSNHNSDISGSFLNEDDQEIFNYLIEMKNSRGEDRDIVDIAWNNLHDRLKKDDLLSKTSSKKSFGFPQLLRIAASVIVLLSLTFTARYLITSKNSSRLYVATTSVNEKNLRVDFPDGSFAYLNRDSELTYPGRFGKGSREVKLKGEAFFDISPDPDKPFIIDAGDAYIKVLGTSFNVITDNGESEVEVLVHSGRVSVSSLNGENKVTLEPGLIGTVNNSSHASFSNTDANYLSWNTEVLVFDGTTLDKVFEDLNRVHNIDLIATSDDILNRRLTTVFDNQSVDTILTMICKTFNLSYETSDKGYFISIK